MNGPPSQQGGPVIPDPINALQSLTQGNRNNQMMGMNPQGGPPMGGPQQMAPIAAPNLMQTLNRGPGQPMGNMQGGMQPRPPMGMGPNPGQMPNQLGNQMPGPLPGQMPSQLQNQLQNPMGNQMQGQMGNPGMPGNMQAAMAAQMQGQMQNQMLGMQQRKSEGMMMNAPNQGGFPRNPTPNPYLRQSPTPSVQSPASLSGPPNSNQ